MLKYILAQNNKKRENIKVGWGFYMLKRKLIFTVLLMTAVMAGNAYATTPAGTDSVGTAHTVYTNIETNTDQYNSEYVVASLGYVNEKVNLAGAAAQAAEDHAAAAGSLADRALGAANAVSTTAVKFNEEDIGVDGIPFWVDSDGYAKPVSSIRPQFLPTANGLKEGIMKAGTIPSGGQGSSTLSQLWIE